MYRDYTISYTYIFKFYNNCEHYIKMNIIVIIAKGRGFESHQGQNLFSHFTLNRVKCEKLFCKTNIKLLSIIYSQRAHEQHNVM